MSIDLFKPYVDFVFKGIFKNSPKALTSLICAIQGWPNDRIKSITYLDTQLTKEHEAGKAGAVDLLVELEDKKKIHIEIQVVHQDFYAERSIFYASRLNGQQLYRGEGYGEIQPLICIHILLFNLFDDRRALHSFHFREDLTYEILSKQLNLVFVEINKVLLDNNLSENVVHWMNFIRNPNEEREMLEHDDSFKEAYEELERLSKDPSKVWAYEMAFKAIKDEESRIKDTASVAQAKGRAQGLAEGRAEGKAEAEIEFIQKMQAKGLTIEQIADLLSISAEQVLSSLQK